MARSVFSRFGHLPHHRAEQRPGADPSDLLLPHQHVPLLQETLRARDLAAPSTPYHPRSLRPRNRSDHALSNPQSSTPPHGPQVLMKAADSALKRYQVACLVLISASILSVSLWGGMLYDRVNPNPEFSSVLNLLG